MAVVRFYDKAGVLLRSEELPATVPGAPDPRVAIRATVLAATTATALRDALADLLTLDLA